MVSYIFSKAIEIKKLIDFNGYEENIRDETFLALIELGISKIHHITDHPNRKPQWGAINMGFRAKDIKIGALI